MLHTLIFSPTGTSRKIARAIAQGFGQECTELDLTHTATATSFTGEQPVLIAVPVYGGHVAPIALERLKGYTGNQTPAILVVLYGNRAYEQALVQLAQEVSAQGFIPVAAGAFIGEHSYSTPTTPIAAGRPDAVDLSQARHFGQAVQRKLAQGEKRPVNVAKLRAPKTDLFHLLRFICFVIGYRHRRTTIPTAMTPTLNESLCTHCGKCARLCPVEAITKGDELHTDPERCIRCCACVKGCPTEARSFSTPFAGPLSRNFRRPKPAVTLL